MSATTGKSDALFWREFGLILGLLVLFFFAMIVLARIIGGAALERIANSENAVSARIAPVAQVRMGDPSKTTAAPAAMPAQPAAAAAPKSGEEVYNTVCMACHVTGAANAPKLGDKAAWEPRVSQGMPAMVANVLKGKGAMPPKGGNPALTEAEIQSAVKFMLEKTGVSAGG